MCKMKLSCIWWCVFLLVLVIYSKPSLTYSEDYKDLLQRLKRDDDSRPIISSSSKPVAILDSDNTLQNPVAAASGDSVSSPSVDKALVNVSTVVPSTVEITNASTTVATTTTTTEPPNQDLPEEGAAESEHTSSLTIFFILLVIAICILMIHLLLKAKFHYLPESVAVVLIGTSFGLILKLLSEKGPNDFQKLEKFPPTIFFLIMLPPIIFESGYNLHKGNFFQNIGTILLFAVVGTAVSALIIGGGIYVLGQAEVIYQFTMSESFAFGSLISAVDPIATIAIFNAIDVDPVLNMLVFGESILNDAVAIVLTTTVLSANDDTDASSGQLFAHAFGRFCVVFIASAAIGVAVGLISALLLKYIDLRKTPSLELGMMLIFAYLPYGLAEGLNMSGIMAILFCALVMSHYTHYNLSPMTQITVQQLFRTLAFMAETCVFAYLGMAIFSFNHVMKPAFIIWSIVLCLVARAGNIFPLSFIANYFREHKLTWKMQGIMWYSGLRGAIAYALCLHLSFDDKEKIRVLVSTTLIIVLFTTLGLGGSTMPLLKIINMKENKRRPKRSRRKINKEVTLSKTQEMGAAVDSSEYFSEMTEDESSAAPTSITKPRLKGFPRLDMKYLVPFFTRSFTQKELRDAKNQIQSLTNQWYEKVRTVSETESESEVDIL